MRRFARRRARGQRGEALVIWCVGFAVLLLPLGGLSVDLWHGIAVERNLQDAASSAAAAGASGIDINQYRQTGEVVLDAESAESLAADNLQRHTGLPAGYQVSAINIQGPVITIQLREDLPLTLLRVLIPGETLRLTATATARATPSGAP